jgi:threonine/homoserine/homoserine lactone efflux protein
MAFVMGSSLTGGRRAGLAAVAGVVAGGVCHTVAGATGASMLLAASPAVFNAVLLAGAAWVAWIGVGLLRQRTSGELVATSAPRTVPATFRQGAVTCLLNPKAYVFVLAVFPRFIDAQLPLAPQAAALMAITAATQIAIYGAVAMVAAAGQQRLARRPGAQLALSRGVGVVLLSFAGLSAAQAVVHAPWLH